MKFKARTIAPSNNDRYWLHTSKGGLNKCILIKDGSVLPNCVGYSWGRWYELLGVEPLLHRGNAENWFTKSFEGYKRGQTPKLGAVACWQKGKAGVASDGAGHVAIVEKIKADGSIVTSNSNYGGTRFFMRTFKPPYSLGGTYKFQGFIYPPVDFVIKTIDELAHEVMLGKWGNGQERVKRLTEAGYDAKAVQARVNKISAEKKKKKTVEEIAKEVILGKWGNAPIRFIKLAAAGYNPVTVQNKVNELLKKK